MRRSHVERSLRDVHGRLKRAREELAVLDEQLDVLNDVADDARIRSLVSETPLAGHEYTDAQRTADAANRCAGCPVRTGYIFLHRSLLFEYLYGPHATNGCFRVMIYKSEL